MVYTPPSLILPTPPVISIVSMWATYGAASMGESQAAPASATAPTANEAQYFPFVVTTTATFTRGFWYNGSAATAVGNVCVAIYNEAQARQATTGAVAAAGNSVIQQAAFSANVTLAPGVYYMGISYSIAGVNGVTAFTASISRGRAAGAYREATGVHPLPATAVFATWTSQVVPVFGVATTSFAI